MKVELLKQHLPVLFLSVILAGYFLGIRNSNLGIYSVTSGSMEPRIKTGSLLVTSKSDRYEIGDVITFTSPKSFEVLSHEIKDVLEKDGKEVYITKGSSNDKEDPFVLYEERVLGKVSLVLPYVGYFFEFLRTELGLLLVVYVPSVFILRKEVQFLWQSALLKRRKLV